MAVFRSTSLRAQLSLTYAGIALLTAVLLGGILLSVLGGYYARAETAYLQAAATQVRRESIPASDPSNLALWASRAALVAQVRVRVYDGSGELLADSGSPRELDLDALETRPPGRHGGGRERLPEPLGGGIFGGASGATSNASLRVGLSTAAGESAGYLVLSEPPASGRAVLRGIAQAWAVAAALALALGRACRLRAVVADLQADRRAYRGERPHGRWRPERSGAGRALG